MGNSTVSSLNEESSIALASSTEWMPSTAAGANSGSRPRIAADEIFQDADVLFAVAAVDRGCSSRSTTAGAAKPGGGRAAELRWFRPSLRVKVEPVVLVDEFAHARR